MSFSSNSNRVKDESLPLKHRASHARSCALHVANKLGVDREEIIDLVEQKTGVSLHQPQSTAELLTGFEALEALRSGKTELLDIHMARSACVIIDLSAVQTPVELHHLLMEKLDFPGWYGCNWNAFWDAITGLVAMPEILQFKGWAGFELRLPGGGNAYE